MDIARRIIEEAYRAGYRVDVDDGDGRPVTMLTAEQAWKAVIAVGVARVYIFSEPDRQPELMLVIPDLGPDETAADFTADRWIESTWNSLYSEFAP